MSSFDRIKRWRPQRSGSGPPPGMIPAEKIALQARRDAAATAAPTEGRDHELLAERERLVERFTLMQADLGGVFYEMAIRDHVRMDVLTRKAAELQRVDAALAEVERALRGDDGPTTGSCPACATPHGAEARFCSRCGHALGVIGNGSEGAGGALGATGAAGIDTTPRVNGSSGAGA